MSRRCLWFLVPNTFKHFDVVGLLARDPSVVSVYVCLCMFVYAYVNILLYLLAGLSVCMCLCVGV